MTGNGTRKSKVLKTQDAIDRKIQDKNIQPPPVECATILIPTLNEVENIDLLMERILSATKAHAFRIEILVVDGGSTDGTQDKVIQWCKKGPVRLVKSDGKGGLSGDILRGAAMAETDVVVVMDADLSHPPEALPSLIRPVLDRTHDMAIGSRYVAGGQTPGWPWTRRIVSRTATLLAWPLVSIRDPMSGFFAARREQLLSLGKEATGFKIALEIAAKGGDSLRVTEIPVTFIDRERGTSKFGTSEIFTCLKQMLLLAGGAVSSGSALRFAAVGSMGVLLDYFIFSLLLSLNVGVIPSHMVSFLGATIFNFFLNARWAFAKTARVNNQPRWQLYAFFLIVCVLALFLRGAVLAVLTEAAGWSPRIAIFFAIASAAIVNFVGLAFFVFPPQIARTTATIRWRVFAIGVVLYSLVLRLAFMGVINLSPQEAYYWSYAQHLDIGYLDHPPMVAWLIWLGTHLLGNREIGVRLPAFLSWLISSFFMYKLGRNLFGKTAGFASLLFIAALPMYCYFAFSITPDAPLCAAWAGCLYFLERALVNRQSKAWVGVGVCLGLGMLSKYTIALLVPAIGLFILLDKESRRWLRRPEPYLALVLALLLFSPVILWNATNDWASFVFQGARRWSGRPEISLHLLIGSVFVILTPVGVLGAIGALIPRGLKTSFFRRETGPNRQWLFSILLTVIPVSVFILHSLRNASKLTWTAPIWLALLPLMGFNLFAEAGHSIAHRMEQFCAKAWRPTMVLLLLFYGGGLYYLYAGLPGLPPIKAMKLPVAWREMGKEVETLRQQVRTETGSDPVIVGLDRYFISSELSFYLPGGNIPGHISGKHLFGMKSLMWRRWVPISAVTGKAVIVIYFDPAHLPNRPLEDYFERLGPVDYRWIKKNNRVVGKFYYRMGYGYRDHSYH
ncbi:MAG: glycosyltransferase [Deltaproteobacteria bacterium]|nr:glycosyltransferase [Deltaproteobacteria bacterium]